MEGADTNCSVTYIKQNFLSITFLIYMQKIDFPKTMIHITVKMKSLSNIECRMSGIPLTD